MQVVMDGDEEEILVKNVFALQPSTRALATSTLSLRLNSARKLLRGAFHFQQGSAYAQPVYFSAADHVQRRNKTLEGLAFVQLRTRLWFCSWREKLESSLGFSVSFLKKKLLKKCILLQAPGSFLSIST